MDEDIPDWAWRLSEGNFRCSWLGMNCWARAARKKYRRNLKGITVNDSSSETIAEKTFGKTWILRVGVGERGSSEFRYACHQ